MKNSAKFMKSDLLKKYICIWHHLAALIQIFVQSSWSSAHMDILEKKWIAEL